LGFGCGVLGHRPIVAPPCRLRERRASPLRLSERVAWPAEILAT
jgi:hypothetical protein